MCVCVCIVYAVYICMCMCVCMYNCVHVIFAKQKKRNITTCFRVVLRVASSRLARWSRKEEKAMGWGWVKSVAWLLIFSLKQIFGFFRESERERGLTAAPMYACVCLYINICVCMYYITGFGRVCALLQFPKGAGASESEREGRR